MFCVSETPIHLQCSQRNPIFDVVVSVLQWSAPTAMGKGRSASLNHSITSLLLLLLRLCARRLFDGCGGSGHILFILMLFVLPVHRLCDSCG